ncbi:hypothetical protein BSL82_02295 [Tardibacter chloracetimidivorans]|uniref:Uncharacterized protein n=1 Tax=Tardibacter chloracetimidivorans TaxID=1921510 RepID=A0A1L3ZRM6_9SPHN|nr:DUF6441 family protein [Tardibacter chloracetimidivorans]API58278.1 hypothetical protein BSL82_02295 [Tardibacter chloracetimidivorans]
MARRSTISRPGFSMLFETERFRRHMALVDQYVLEAAYRAVRETTREAEKALEQVTASAGLGRLSRAWASEIYPERGRAREPVGSIYVKGRKRSQGAMAAYARGARISGSYGQYLAIPLPAAGPRRRGQDLTPGEWERRTGIRLQFVYRRGKPALLVAPGAINMRSGRFRKATARRIEQGRHASVPIFVLLPLVDVQQRFSIKQTLAPFSGRLASRFTGYARLAAQRAEREL